MKKNQLLWLSFLIVFLLVGCSGQSPEQQVQKALEHRAQGDYQAAILEFKNAIQQEPTLALARFELGKTYMLTHDYASAEKELTRAKELGFSPSQVLPLLSKAYQRTRADVALTQLEINDRGLTEIEQLEIGYRQALTLVSLEKKAAALKLTDSLQNLAADSIYKDLIDVIPELISQDYTSALTVADLAHKRAPLNIDVLMLNARLYALTEMYDESIDMYREYLRIEPSDLEVKFALAALLVQQRKAEQAAPLLDELLNINDQSPLLNQLKSMSEVALTNYGSALTYAEKAISSRRNDPILRIIAGFSAYKTAQYDRAVEHLSLIAELLPNDHIGLRLLAASQVNSKTSAQVSDVLQRIDLLESSDINLFSNAAIALANADDEQAAAEVLERTKELLSTPEDLVQYGIIKLLSLNDLDGIVYLEEAIAEQDKVEPKQALAMAYFATQQFDKALEVVTEWERLNPDDSDAKLIRAKVAFQKEEYAASMDYVNSVITAQPNNKEAKLLFAQLLVQQKQFVLALDAANQLLKTMPDNQLAWRVRFDSTENQQTKLRYLEELRDYLDENQTDIAMRLFTADMALSLSNTEVALDALSPLKFDSDTPQHIWRLKGRVLYYAEKLDQAEQHYMQWNTLFPFQEDAALGLIRVLNKSRRFETAAAVATDFLKSESNDQIAVARAHFLALTGRLQETKEVYTGLPQELKTTPFVRGINARIALFEKRPKEAIDDAQAAYDQIKNYDNLNLVTQVLTSAKQRDTAIAVLEQHVDELQNDVLAIMLLAEYKFSEEPEAAMTLYKRAIELLPDNAVALNNVAYLHKQKGEIEIARDYAEKAYAIFPANPGIADTYAQVLLTMGEVDEAVKTYEYLLSASNAAEFIQLNYVEALLVQGEKELAKRKLKGMKFSTPASFLTLEKLSKEYELDI